MSRSAPQAGCHEVGFRRSYPMTESAEVALEDYARTLLRARAAEAARADGDPGVVGIHVCGLDVAATSALLDDIEAFASGLDAGAGSGLGWS